VNSRLPPKQWLVVRFWVLHRSRDVGRRHSGERASS
jgi:hypothetical protein